MLLWFEYITFYTRNNFLLMQKTQKRRKKVKK